MIGQQVNAVRREGRFGENEAGIMIGKVTVATATAASMMIILLMLMMVIVMIMLVKMTADLWQRDWDLGDGIGHSR